MFPQLNMLEEGLINHPVVGFGESGRKASELRILLAKIEESEVCVSWIHIFFLAVACHQTMLKCSIHLYSFHD